MFNKFTVNIGSNLHRQNAVCGVFRCCRFTLMLGRENVLGISGNHDRLGDQFAHGFNKSLLSANSKTGIISLIWLQNTIWRQLIFLKLSPWWVPSTEQTVKHGAEVTQRLNRIIHMKSRIKVVTFYYCNIIILFFKNGFSFCGILPWNIRVISLNVY